VFIVFPSHVIVLSRYHFLERIRCIISQQESKFYGHAKNFLDQQTVSCSSIIEHDTIESASRAGCSRSSHKDAKRIAVIAFIRIARKLRIAAFRYELTKRRKNHASDEHFRSISKKFRNDSSNEFLTRSRFDRQRSRKRIIIIAICTSSLIPLSRIAY